MSVTARAEEAREAVERYDRLIGAAEALAEQSARAAAGVARRVDALEAEAVAAGRARAERTSEETLARNFGYHFDFSGPASGGAAGPAPAGAPRRPGAPPARAPAEAAGSPGTRRAVVTGPPRDHALRRDPGAPEPPRAARAPALRRPASARTPRAPSLERTRSAELQGWETSVGAGDTAELTLAGFARPRVGGNDAGGGAGNLRRTLSAGSSPDAARAGARAPSSPLGPWGSRGGRDVSVLLPRARVPRAPPRGLGRTSPGRG
jgi:hypothetical protein